MRRTRSFFMTFLALGLSWTMVAGADEQPRIVNGVTTHAYPTTGALLVGTNPGSAGLQCSGTLIGCNTFLTASHCVEGDSNPAHYFVFLQHAGVFSVTKVAPHDDYRPENFPLADVAVLELGSQVSGIDPTAINLTDPTPFIPHAATIVGFGQTLGGANDYGIKRAGAVQTMSCPVTVGDDEELVCWSYSAPVGPPGTDSNTCNGDSGGPLLMDLGSGEAVAGVTSGGTNATCGTGDHSFDASVFAYGAHVLDRLGSDSTSSCGPIPAVGAAGASIVGEDGSLGSGNTSDAYSVTLSSPANVLRFTLNGEENGDLDADLYVRQGAPATTSSFDCKSDGSGNFGACEFELPAVDTWHVLIQRASGSGDYQLTTTIFGGPAPACGNNTTETGEECDGTDDAACDGLCNNLACTCPPPSCGNDVTERGEECDGTGTQGCLGACEADCTCEPVCGDESCDPSETASNCPSDCGCDAVGACAFGDAPGGCYCDPPCQVFGDCCPDACVVCGVCDPGCGNDILEIGEECDDGNNDAGDCCAPDCQAEAAGGACDDGSECSSSDQCDGAGGCVGDAELATSCFEAGKALLRIDDKDGGNRDRVKWNWLQGETVALVDLGSPETTTSYELCIFDRAASQPELALSARLAPTQLWDLKPGSFWKYRDTAAFHDGISSLQLRAGTGGLSKVKFKARGTRLSLPGPDGPGYFTQNPSVVVQLRNSAGSCWTTEFTTATTSRADLFSAKIP